MEQVLVVAVLLFWGDMGAMDRPPLLVVDQKKSSSRIQRIQASPRAVDVSPRQPKSRFPSLACMAARCLAQRYDLISNQMLDLITPQDQVCVKEIMLRELIKPYIFPLVICCSQNKESVHHNGVCGLDFNPETNEVVSGACDGKIVFCKKDSLAAGIASVTQISVSALSIACQDHEIFIGSEGNKGNIYRMNYGTKNIDSFFEAHEGNVTRICVGQDIFASASNDTTVRVWKKKTASPLAVFKEGSQAVRCLELVEDDTILISGSSEGKLSLRNLETGALCGQYTYQGRPRVWGMGYMPKTGRIAVGLNSGTISLLDPITMQEIAHWYGHGQTISGLSCDAEEKYFATGSWDFKARLWDVRMRACAATFNGHKNWVTQIKCLGNEVVTGSRDSTLKLWDVRKIKEMDSLPLPQIAAMAARLKDTHKTVWEHHERAALMNQLLTKTT